MADTASHDVTADVVVVGAGVAGLSAAIVLARHGLGVVCVDPDSPPRRRVGESLDWAAPALLDAVGLSAQQLVGEGSATWKRKVLGLSSSGRRMVGRPRGWMNRWPFRFPVETVHVDRHRFDEALCDLAAAAGVRFMWDAVSRVEIDGDRVTGCLTRSQMNLIAPWFLDASGRARLFARAFGIDRLEQGSPRTALWAQRDAPQVVDGTVLHLDDGPAELRWAWEIPLSPDRQSIGVLIPESEFRDLRRRTPDPVDILHDVLPSFPGMERFPPSNRSGVHVRGVRCYTHARVAGANWMMIGEAAAVVDPLTSTGVSAAMRHGVEAAGIVQSGAPHRVVRALRRFDRRVRSVATLYNKAAQDLLYAPAVRRTVGIRWAGRAYVILGFGMSTLYGRIGGPGWARHTAVIGIGGAFRLWLLGWLSLGGVMRHADSIGLSHAPSLTPPMEFEEGRRR